MPILDQGYQHWDGEAGGRVFRWLAITRQGIRAQFKNRWMISTLVGALAPALALAGFLVIWGLFEQQATILDPLLFLFRGLPEEIRAGPIGFRSTFWTLAFSLFLRVQTFFAFVLVMLVGPELISQDLRFNALPLYLSRPLRRIDYFLGKFGVIAAFLLGIMLVPALLAYLIGLAFSLDPAVFAATWRVLAASAAYSAVVAASMGLLMLALSSLSRNSRLVTAMWVGLWMLGGAAVDAARQTPARDLAPLASYPANLASVREALFDHEAHVGHLSDVFRRGREAVESMGGRGRPRIFGIPFGPPAPPPPPRDPFGLDDSDPFPPSVGGGGPPWPASAAVLAGLGAASILILSTRVRSLDRLK